MIRVDFGKGLRLPSYGAPYGADGESGPNVGGTAQAVGAADLCTELGAWCSPVAPRHVVGSLKPTESAAKIERLGPSLIL
ncbi:hypothetical protein BYT27DRAFT_7184172 [Phlegmacium glaucopus]|nr:hypothetical protein BYT27DRAFT_7184172 [Phlegmacium glaucopus]